MMVFRKKYAARRPVRRYRRVKRTPYRRRYSRKRVFRRRRPTTTKIFNTRITLPIDFELDARGNFQILTYYEAADMQSDPGIKGVLDAYSLVYNMVKVNRVSDKFWLTNNTESPGDKEPYIQHWTALDSDAQGRKWTTASFTLSSRAKMVLMRQGKAYHYSLRPVTGAVPINHTSGGYSVQTGRRGTDNPWQDVANFPAGASYKPVESSNAIQHHFQGLAGQHISLLRTFYISYRQQRPGQEYQPNIVLI